MKFYYIILLLALTFSCKDIPVGYLEIDKAGYQEDLIVRHTLSDSPEDQKRIEQNIPWVSYMIEGVDGTRPIFYAIDKITPNAGQDVSKANELIKLRGDGAFEVPLKKDNEEYIPIGEYTVDIRIFNEGHSKILKGKMKIIVQEK